ncbi:YqgE/AlgH family protein [Limibacillus sp. MBR-115]|jgi:putative transcriptional regulator|uniref:YqgE/AlgH family protein n=1 Tax=Limibacillus sp. MBR-115 TaxID=3156465 RepID=UPI00339472A8
MTDQQENQKTDKAQGNSKNTGLTGQLLIAMPGMSDPRFNRSVVYICAHNADGAMGLVINKAVDELTFDDLLEQFEIENQAASDAISIHFGGPVETQRGFVLHSPDYLREGSLQVDEHVALTATVQILQDIAAGAGPRFKLLALGYSGWGPGQLDAEIQQNAWLNVAADDALVFGPDIAAKWESAIRKLGVEPSMLSGSAGHA